MFEDADEIFAQLKRLHLRAERQFFSLLLPSKERPAAAGKWHPLADIYETDTAWVIKVELAGVRPEDFSLTVEKGVLTVKGTRRDEFEGRWRRFHQAEIPYYEFERSFSIPPSGDEGGIKAIYKDGMLTITIPKPPPPAPEKRIEISVT